MTAPELGESRIQLALLPSPWLSIFIARKDHTQPGSKLEQSLRALGSEVLIQKLTEPTLSPVHTLNAARHHWQNASSLLITNCDQFLAVPISPWIDAFERSAADIGILTVESADPHFVHLEVSEANVVTRIVGKVVSDLQAAAGYYLFRSGNLLADLIDRTLSVTDRSRELCVTDVITEAMALQLRVQAWSLGCVGEKYFPLGDPTYVARYESQLLKL